jgi:hypothetical protein
MEIIVHRGGENYGPYTIDQLMEHLSEGALDEEDLAWHQGCDDWKTVKAILSLVDIPPTTTAQSSVPRIVSASSGQGSYEAISKLSNVTPYPLHRMEGPNDVLEVFQDKLTIAPQGLGGLLTRGLKGTKTIPFFSITAIQYKPAGMLTRGYLQFTIPGGNESRGGLTDAMYDENTFVFNDADNNHSVEKIKNFIEKAINDLRAPRVVASASVSISDEITKLSRLMSDGILTQSEFQAAKARLLGR